MKICFIGGCGRLGFAIAVWSAYRGHDVVCADVNEAAVNEVFSGKSPVSETHTQYFLDHAYDNGGRIQATTDIIAAVDESELIFILVPTPSKGDGTFDTRFVETAIEDIAMVLATSKQHKTIVISSTVNPGDTRKLQQGIEHLARKKRGEDFDVFYSPEFIRQGSTIEDFSAPASILIGVDSYNNINILLKYYESVLRKKLYAEVAVTALSYESAEIAKIGLNAFLGLKIAMANQIMWTCHYTPGASAEYVMNFIGFDPRIGKALTKPGLWAGGPCLPRDNVCLSAYAKALGAPHAISDAVTESAREQLINICNVIGGLPGTIGVIGLTYKDGVDITEEAPGVSVAMEMQHNRKRKVFVYDPRTIVRGLSFANSLAHLVELCDVLMIAMPYEGLREELKTVDLSKKAVVDCWNWGGDPLRMLCYKYIVIGEHNATKA